MVATGAVNGIGSSFALLELVSGLRRLFLHAVQAGNLNGLPFRANRGHRLSGGCCHTGVADAPCCWIPKQAHIFSQLPHSEINLVTPSRSLIILTTKYALLTKQ